jgi:hypothetical protein
MSHPMWLPNLILPEMTSSIPGSDLEFNTLAELQAPAPLNWLSGPDFTMEGADPRVRC